MNPLYYIPVHSNIISQLNQLKWIYYECARDNRTLIISSYLEICNLKSDGIFHLCDFIKFPQGVDCMFSTPKYMLDTKNCKIDKANEHHIRSVDEFSASKAVLSKDTFNFISNDCIIGNLYDPLQQYDYSLLYESHFQTKYILLYEFALEILNISTNDYYMYVDWSTYTCLHNNDSNHSNKNVNIMEAIKRVKQFYLLNHKSSTYVSIHEEEVDSTIEQLQLAGYVTTHNLYPYIGLKENSVDMVLVELMLMCNAYIFISDGAIDLQYISELCPFGNISTRIDLNINNILWLRSYDHPETHSLMTDQMNPLAVDDHILPRWMINNTKYQDRIAHKAMALIHLDDIVISSSHPVYYISTHEGIASHLHQLDILFWKLYPVNRSIIITPFPCQHYPHMDELNLCNYFKFPFNIKCANVSYKIIATTKACVLYGQRDKGSAVRANYNLPIETPMTRTINYSQIECIAGGMGPIHDSSNHIFAKVAFQDDYMALYHSAMTLLNYSMEGYGVIHWRRGDQLWLRCKKVIDYHCYDVNKFIHFIENNIRKNFFSTRYKIYIATNEHDAKIYETLSRQGYDTIKSISSPLNLSDNSVDIFILELILMCHANAFFSGGETSIKRLIEICRTSNKLNNTFINHDT